MVNNCPEKSSIHTHNWVTHIIIRLFCRRGDRKIAFNLYQYFRRCDDYVDDPALDQRAKLLFVDDQRKKINEMYNGNFKDDSQLASIIRNDREHYNSLQGIFNEMFDVFEFDARRGNKTSAAQPLIDYSLKLSHAYTTLLIMFLDPEHKISEHDIQLAHGCHLVHMLRDFYADQKLGYLNIPVEDKEKIDLDNPDSENFRQWVRDRVNVVEEKLKNGKKNMIKTPYMRIQLIALLYCFRYEIIIRQLKANGFILKQKYPVRITDAGCLLKTLASIFFQSLSVKFAIL